MVSVSSVADSRSGYPSTGNIYFYLAKESLKYKDLIVKNQASMLFSEAHTMRCQQRGTDPMEPTCKRAMLSGKVIQVIYHILITNKMYIRLYCSDQKRNCRVWLCASCFRGPSSSVRELVGNSWNDIVPIEDRAYSGHWFLWWSERSQRKRLLQGQGRAWWGTESTDAVGHRLDRQRKWADL